MRVTNLLQNVTFDLNLAQHGKSAECHSLRFQISFIDMRSHIFIIKFQISHNKLYLKHINHLK